ncbi:hypothetical protein TRICI_005337 [Trichomonascus ciferrii]|uniref:A to I editase domain-containing protein n=1 Tax=Trichomonascus ciferrii TaxID=44093 RepID=A0A642UT17_9ASCO|nr:hypothetical protein TRICI_005337 [Trichomonascus ciferrii]
MPTPEEVAKEVIETYQKLPGKGKPHVRSNGKEEWTILAGIVLIPEDGICECVSLGTGMKATPNEQLNKANGRVLHDMHAEVLAIRGFNRFLIEECGNVIAGSSSRWVSKIENGSRMFRLDPNVVIAMYVSEPPCGDSSMSQLSEGMTDCWTDPLNTIGEGTVRGRDHVFTVGLVRTKPGRRDSPITYSKSCTDKLALRQCTSLLLGPVAERLIDPADVYLSTLVVGNNCRYSDTHRAFTTRMISATGFKYGSYACHFFSVRKAPFPIFRDGKSPDALPCPKSIVYVSNTKNEVILGGVKMGAKPFKGKGESQVCRNQILKSVTRLTGESTGLYSGYKTSADRQSMKARVYQILCNGNWVPTKSDDF